MEAIKRQIRFQIMDGSRAFGIFWLIVVIVNILFYTFLSWGFQFGVVESGAGVRMGENTIEHMYTNVSMGNMISIFIFIIVYSMVMYYETFPIAIVFSTTRKNFYIGVMIHNTLLCLGMSIIQGILLKLDAFFVRLAGHEPLYTFGSWDIREVNVVYIIGGLWIGFLVVCGIFNMLGALAYKFGYKTWIVLGSLAVLFLNLGVARIFFRGMISGVMKYNGFADFLGKAIFTAIILYGIGWFLVRGLEVKQTKL